MKTKHFICLLAGLALGCREVIELDLPDTPSRLVVEALFTDGPGPHTVELSSSYNYFSEQAAPEVSGALVTIEDLDDGYTEELTEVIPGQYQAIQFRGIRGNAYRLTINVDGEVYTSEATMPGAPVFDSLNYKYSEGSTFRDEGFYIYFYGKTDKSQINYYRWLVFENDSVYGGRGDYLLATDEFIQENVIGLEFPYEFQLGDTVRIEMYGLNQDIYNYYNELVSLLFNDGGLFSPPPVNPTTNIINETNHDNPPLGYFQVSSIIAKGVVIE